MTLKVDQIFPARQVDIEFNDVPGAVEIQIDNTVEDGLVHVQGDIPMFVGWGVRILCTSIGDTLKITADRARFTDGFNVPDTGNTTVSGGGANAGVNTGGKEEEPEAEEFSEVKQTATLHWDMSPKATIKLFVGPNGLRYRITK